jgi:hypothetical protein
MGRMQMQMPSDTFKKRNFNKEVADKFKDPSKEELNTDDSLQTFQRTRTKPRCIIEKSRINLKITLKTFDFKTEDSNASVFLLKKTTMSHQKLNALHPKKYNIYCFHWRKLKQRKRDYQYTVDNQLLFIKILNSSNK